MSPLMLALHVAVAVLLCLTLAGAWALALVYEPERPPSHELPPIPVPDYPSEL